MHWLARGREQAAWGRTAHLIVGVARMFGEKDLQPADVLPDWLREAVPLPPPKSEARLARENRNAWKLLDRFFGG